jgi:ssDNA-binding Zn-finger/Zn-ribbon topoisomerase 1
MSNDNDPSAFGFHGYCPVCGKAMMIVEVTPKDDEQPEVRTFQCPDCDHLLRMEVEE